MLKEPELRQGVMEGRGAYNKHASVPAVGGLLAAPLLQRAAEEIHLDSSVDRPIAIADYGAAQGKNSLLPLCLAIRALSGRISPDRAIVVFHIDQQTNDFKTLFEVVSADPERYALERENVFSCAVGKSFYQQVLPRNSVDLGWCSYAAVWLKRIPCTIPGHFFPPCSTGSARADLEKAGAESWESFLRLRAREMRAGARLVVVLPALPETRQGGFVTMMNHANGVLEEMEADGAITREERARMVVGTYARRKGELLAPFHGEEFEGLRVEELTQSPHPDSAWMDYERDGNGEAWATKQALFFRAVFMPSLAAALERVRAGDAEAERSFADRLQTGLITRLRDEPRPADMFVQMLMLAKG